MASRTLQAETNKGIGYTETTDGDAQVVESGIDPSNLADATALDTGDYIIVSDGGVPKKITKANFKVEGLGDDDGDTKITLVEGADDSVDIYVDGTKMISVSSSNVVIDNFKDLNVKGSLYLNGTIRINNSGAGTFASLTENGEPICRWRGSDADPETNITDAENGDVVYDTTDSAIRVYDGMDWLPVSGP